MAIEKLTKDLNIIQKLDDEPNDVGGLTSAELKAEFDKAGNEIKEYLNNTVVPAINSVQTQVNASTADQHTHSNKALLDTYDQTNADIKDAIAKEHTHGNKDVLDSITADQQAVLASIKGVTKTLGNATDKVPSEKAVAEAMAMNGNIPSGGTTGQALVKASGNALDVTWKTINAETLGVPNPNLLDNWYFGNPVNQRGQTSYSGVSIYTIDRWIVNNGNGTIAIEEDGIRITSTSSAYYTFFEQIIDSSAADEPMCASALVSEVTGKAYLRFRYADGAVSGADLKPGVAVCTSNGKAVQRVRIHLEIGASVKLKAVKLELGSQQTLAHQDESGNWVLNEIPNYHEECLKCIQATVDSTDEYANKVIYHTGNKPTAADVGARSLAAMTSIPSGANLNDYKTPGSYRCSSSSIAATLTNSPVTNTGFSLHVEWVSGGSVNYLRQTIVANSKYVYGYERSCQSGTFYDWETVVTTANIEDVYGTIKPTGTYTGTERDRTITIGGIGKFLMLHSVGHTGIVTPAGAIYFYNGRDTESVDHSRSSYEYVEIQRFESGTTFISGVLTLDADSDFNYEETTYEYQVL